MELGFCHGRQLHNRLVIIPYRIPCAAAYPFTCQQHQLHQITGRLQPMKVSAAYRYDAIQPQLFCRSVLVLYTHTVLQQTCTLARIKDCSSCKKLALLLKHSVLVHLYLNNRLEFSLCADPCMGHCHVFKALDSWATSKVHPAGGPRIKRFKDMAVTHAWICTSSFSSGNPL